jgi:uncharacterized Ntn-hydrolase superfamily protein
MTFSIVARSEEGGYFGVAIASSSPAVASRCAHARAGLGAVATQNITDPALGPAILNLLQQESAAGAVRIALEATPFGDYRQILAIARTGPPALHSGAQALGVVAMKAGEHCAAAGNLLAREAVPAAMVAAFEASSGHFGERLLQSLEAGLAAGGEAGPIHSAGLYVVREVSWPIVDLRVDWREAPIEELRAIWRVCAPQIEDYVRRALHPGQAPRFGVPGDL